MRVRRPLSRMRPVVHAPASSSRALCSDAAHRPRPSPRPPGRTRPWGAGREDQAWDPPQAGRRLASTPPTRAARMTPVPLACLAAPPGAVQGPPVRPRRVPCVGQRPTRTVSWAGRPRCRPRRRPASSAPAKGTQPVSPRRPAWVRSCSPAFTSAKACPLHSSKNQQNKPQDPYLLCPESGLPRVPHGRNPPPLQRSSRESRVVLYDFPRARAREPKRDTMAPGNAR